MTAAALIGWSGFVGGNLLRQRAFDGCFRRSDVHQLREQRWDLVVCAGMPAEKWRANQDPASDAASLHHLQAALDGAAIDRLVLISTVDVYPQPVGVDESSAIDPGLLQPYGRHRLALERWVAERFPTTIVRLPGLFGPGLKKNVIFDLLHGNRLDLVHADAVFQFYPLDRLWSDVERLMACDIALANLPTAPVTVAAVGEAITGAPFVGRPAAIVPVRYDIGTRHAVELGGQGRYLMSDGEVLAALAAYASHERRTQAP